MDRRSFLAYAAAAAAGTTLSSRASAQATTTLRIASVSGPQHHHNVALRIYADEVAKRAPTLKLNVLDGAQLGGERDYIEGMILGSIDMAQVSTGPVSAFIPQFDLFSLPYLFRDTDHFVRVTQGPVGERFFKLLEARGIRGLCWFDNGYRNVFNNKRPVREPQDMKGLKIRVMESPMMIGTVNAMGGSATPMAYGELYTALQQNVLDGAENAPGNVLNDKFFEVAKYYSLTKHFRPPGVFAISMKAWDRLTESQRAALVAEAKTLQGKVIELTAKVEVEAIDKLKAAGMQVNEVEIEAFRKAVQPTYKLFTDKHGTELVELVSKT